MKIPLYVLVALLLAVSIYLKSPVVAVSSVVLWGIASAESVLAKAAKDAEIQMLIARADKYEARLKVLEHDVVNVAERAKTILGEVY
jgi:hypothetical protein